MEIDFFNQCKQMSNFIAKFSQYNVAYRSVKYPDFIVPFTHPIQGYFTLPFCVKDMNMEWGSLLFHLG